ncbi:MAG: hypothetical protein V2J55_10465 [Candidatus Competibacteraceae bacterium]|jgi:hypothetical protein|nr:hypothetical protein [Candidatus Competibacteraceae bacterium]
MTNRHYLTQELAIINTEIAQLKQRCDARKVELQNLQNDDDRFRINYLDCKIDEDEQRLLGLELQRDRLLRTDTAK